MKDVWKMTMVIMVKVSSGQFYRQFDSSIQQQGDLIMT